MLRGRSEITGFWNFDVGVKAGCVDSWVFEKRKPEEFYLYSQEVYFIIPYGESERHIALDISGKDSIQTYLNEKFKSGEAPRLYIDWIGDEEAIDAATIRHSYAAVNMVGWGELITSPQAALVELLRQKAMKDALELDANRERIMQLVRYKQRLGMVDYGIF